jgi:uncharacterized repeat protein (TIGR01451 family)
MRNIGGITLYLFIFMITMTLAQPAQGGDWTMFMHDLSHTGTSDEVVQPPLELLWNYSTAGSIESSSVISSSPVISKGMLYIGDNGGIHAIDAMGGSLKWKYRTGEVHSAPAVSDGTVYAGSNDHIVYALDAATGALKWKYTTDGGVSSSPAVSAGVVYVGSFYPGRSLYALDAATGTLKWKYETGESVWSSPAVSGGVVYAGSDDNNVYALDAATGAVKWNFTATNFIESSPAVSGGMVYVGSGDKNVYALDAATGNLKWKYTTEGYVHSSPAISGGIVYVGSDDHNFYALDAATGALKWSYKTGGVISSSPAISDGVVYVGSKDKNIYALDARKGALIWKYTTGNSILSSPAISGGRIYAASTDRIYAFESTSSGWTNLGVSINAPESASKGGLITYILFLNNFGNRSASDVILQDTIPAGVDFISASDGGKYDVATKKVTWNIGKLGPSSNGARTLSVRIRNDVAPATMIKNEADISTTTKETSHEDNKAISSTGITSFIFLDVKPLRDIDRNGNGIIHWQDNVTFGPYQCNDNNLNESNPPIAVFNITNETTGMPEILNKPMHINWTETNSTGVRSWEVNITFYSADPSNPNKHYHGPMNLTIDYPSTSSCADFKLLVNFYIDPAGYIYDKDTGLRIAKATVWLQRPDGLGGWENVPTGQIPNISQPDINPLITGIFGQYQWDVLPGAYRVHVKAPGYYPAESIVVNIPPPVTNLHVGLKRLPLFNISGFKIEDTNANGRWDDNEIGIPNWRIMLRNATTGEEIADIITNVDGKYEFMNQTNGIYNISEETRPNYTPTGATFRIVTVTGGDLTDQNFTNKIPAVNIFGAMFVIALAFICATKRKER